MNRTLQVITASILGSAFLASHVLGSCIWTPFEDQVRRAEIIFAGTVTNVECEKIPTTIITRYRFGGVRYAKGSGPADSLVLVHEGGTVGNMSMTTSVSVSFRNGARYIVFAIKGYGALPDHYRAMACGTGHPLEISPDSGATRAVVDNWTAAFERRDMAIRTWPHQNRGRVKEDELLRTLAGFAARASSGSRGDSIPAR